MSFPSYSCRHYSLDHNPNPNTPVPTLCESCIRQRRDAALFQINVKYVPRITQAEADAFNRMGQDEELIKKVQDLHARMAREEEEVRRLYAEMEEDRRAMVKAMC